MRENERNDWQQARATTRAMLRRPVGHGDAFVTPGAHRVTPRAAATAWTAEKRTP